MGPKSVRWSGNRFWDPKLFCLLRPTSTGCGICTVLSGSRTDYSQGSGWALPGSGPDFRSYCSNRIRFRSYFETRIRIRPHFETPIRIRPHFENRIRIRTPAYNPLSKTSKKCTHIYIYIGNSNRSLKITADNK